MFRSFLSYNKSKFTRVGIIENPCIKYPSLNLILYTREECTSIMEAENAPSNFGLFRRTQKKQKTG